MSTMSKVGGAGAKRMLAGGLLALLATSCGDFVSWDDRWLFDTGGDHAGSAPSDQPQGISCEAAAVDGYHYADPPEFWLGEQTPLDVSVGGAGYLVAGSAAAPPDARRFARSGALFVAPDGTISLGPDEPALGFAPGTAPGGSCLVELRAPVFSPPLETTRIELRMNIDPRAVPVTFDILDPNGTSNASTSVVVFDSLGAAHLLDIYFGNVGLGLVTYHVVADGSDIEQGVPGYSVDLSNGTLQFNSFGGLDLATTPALAASFSGGATANQVIELSWGPDIQIDGSSGYAGSTMFAVPTAVYSLSADGRPAGTGTDIEVGAAGDVLVRFDNGDALGIGTLALARFSQEGALAPLGGDSWRVTPGSGAPQFGAPRGPGRGSIDVIVPGSP
jgi:flagellar hook protein FlgE